MRRLSSIDEILALFDAFGDDNYDEELSQRDHALQTAALAVADGADDALVAAALLHDIGHLLDLEDGGTAAAPISTLHEATGAGALADLFDERVTVPIALHVAAKRYLTAIEPDLVARLSNGSRASLARQGGPMSTEELRRFEGQPGSSTACALRRWDDAGKIEDLDVAPLSSYVPLLRRTARSDQS